MEWIAGKLQDVQSQLGTNLEEKQLPRLSNVICHASYIIRHSPYDMCQTSLGLGGGGGGAGVLRRLSCTLSSPPLSPPPVQPCREPYGTLTSQVPPRGLTSRGG